MTGLRRIRNVTDTYRTAYRKYERCTYDEKYVAILWLELGQIGHDKNAKINMTQLTQLAHFSLIINKGNCAKCAKSVTTKFKI